MSEGLNFTNKIESEVSFEHSVESYREILFWSFMLSQGKFEIQRQVLDYVIEKMGVFDPEMYRSAQDQFAEKYFSENELELSGAMLRFHKPIDYKPVTTEREYDWSREFDTSSPLKILKYQLSFLERPMTSEVAQSDLRLFANLTWYQDREYIAPSKYGTPAKGRPNRNSDNEGSGKLNDKWFSFGVHYFIKGNGIPSVPVLNQLMIDARSVNPLSEYKSEKFQRLNLTRINDVIEAYNLHHKDKMTSSNEINRYFSAIKTDIDSDE